MFTHDQKVYSTCDFNVVLTLLLHTILRGTDNAAYWTVPFLITFRSFTYCESFQVRLFFCRTFVRQFLRTQLTGASRGPSAIADPLNWHDDRHRDRPDRRWACAQQPAACYFWSCLVQSIVFSERELTSRSLFAVARPSVCRLSVVCL